jgi:uncharacterized protein YuzE
LRAGVVEETVEIVEDVNLDVDAEGNALGVEFVDTRKFFELLTSGGGTLDIPDRIAIHAST